MNPPPTTPTPKGTWLFPYLELKLADGSILLKPQKPVFRASAKVTAKCTGLSYKTLARLAESGFIRSIRGTPILTFYYPHDVEAFLSQTEADPDYWTAARRAQYGLARRKKS